MNRTRIAALLGICLFASVGVSRANVGPVAAQFGYSASADWSTPGHHVSIAIEHRDDSTQVGDTPLDTYAIISVFDYHEFYGSYAVVSTSIRRGSRSARPFPGPYPWYMRSGCDATVKLQSGQFQSDTSLGSATLDIPSTPCGAVSVKWLAIGDLQPTTANGSSPYGFEGFGSTLGTEVQAGVTRAQEASGTVGKISMSTDDVNAATLFLGASSSVFLDGFSPFTHATAFRGVGIQFRQGNTVGRVFGYNYAAQGRAGLSGPEHETNRTWGCVMIFTFHGTPIAGKRYPRTFGAFACGPISLTLDPALATGHLVGKFGSITTDLTFAATGNLTPETHVPPPPVFSPNPSNPVPWFFLRGSAFVSRPALTTGSVQSKSGNVSLNNMKAVLCEGASALLYQESYYGGW